MKWTISMATIFLALIYLAFVSLGLPDSLLGAAWPAMRQALGLPLSGASILAMIITCCTVVSSLMSGRILARFGTGKTMVCSVLLTAISLFGMSFAPSFIYLCLLSIPLGLGAGSVDTGLNNFVALHYKASHMSWLHCFWGVGTTVGPFIMSAALVSSSWNTGYLNIGIVQFIVAALLLFSLPLWKKYEPVKPGLEGDGTRSGRTALKQRGVWVALLSFFIYCSLETTAGLWGASFLAEVKGLDLKTAASFGAAFYFGITIGRLLSGFVAMRVSARKLILIGAMLCVCSSAALILPLPASICGVLLVLLGAGCAPIFPSLLHETPRRFGDANSAQLIGLQMSCAYCGVFITTPIIGLVAGSIGLWIYPIMLTIFAAFLLLFCVVSDKIFKNNTRVSENE